MIHLPSQPPLFFTKLNLAPKQISYPSQAQINLPAPPNLPKSLDSWLVLVKRFRTRFADDDSVSTLTMESFTPSLSGAIGQFQDVSVPIEVVSSLVRFVEKHGEAVLSQVSKYGPAFKSIFFRGLGILLLSMECYPVTNEEMFIVWKNECKDLMRVGFDISFMLDILKDSSELYFGYLLKASGHDQECAEIFGLSEQIRELEESLNCLKLKFSQKLSHLKSGINMPVISSQILQSTWSCTSRVAHRMY